MSIYVYTLHENVRHCQVFIDPCITIASMRTERDQNKDLLTKRRYATVSCNDNDCDWSSDGYVLLTDLELYLDMVLTNGIAQNIIKHHQRTHSFSNDRGHQDYTIFLLNEHIIKPIEANSGRVIYLGSKE